MVTQYSSTLYGFVNKVLDNKVEVQLAWKDNGEFDPGLLDYLTDEEVLRKMFTFVNESTGFVRVVHLGQPDRLGSTNESELSSDPAVPPGFGPYGSSSQGS